MPEWIRSKKRENILCYVVNFGLAEHKIAENIILIIATVGKNDAFGLLLFGHVKICLDHELSTLRKWFCADCLNTMKPGGKPCRRRSTQNILENHHKSYSGTFLIPFKVPVMGYTYPESSHIPGNISSSHFFCHHDHSLFHFFLGFLPQGRIFFFSVTKLQAYTTQQI